MKQYLDLLENVLTNGVWQENRTGIRTKMIPGAMMQFDMADGFPAITTKQLAFKSVVGELLGFLRGYTSAAQFRELGCKIWDANANKNEAWLQSPYRYGEDDLGYIYSRLWTDMPVDVDFEPYCWNQIQKLIDGIRVDPSSRRHIVSAWHPEVFPRAALPPCHVLFQVIIEQETRKMHLGMYQRSVDTFLGLPFNVASYSLLLHLLAEATGYVPGTFTWFGMDVHLYEDHIPQTIQQLTREPYPLPKLEISGSIRLSEYLTKVQPEDLSIKETYKCHPPIKASMAV